MKHLLSAFVCCIVMTKAMSQKGIDNMIQAERNFAAYALEHSVKQAFLRFMDSSAVEVEEGKPVSGLQLWTKRQENPSVLKWHPQYAEIAASNDFGYTTGPWTYQNSADDTVSRRGQFNTIWHIDKNGQWKFLVDMGTSYKAVNNAQSVQEVKTNTIQNATLQSMLAEEDAFTKGAASNSSNAYKAYLSSKSIINRIGSLPARSVSEQAALIKNLPPGIAYTRLGEGLATSGDLGYVYGSLALNQKNTAYLHVWRHERSGWKLALEVLQL